MVEVAAIASGTLIALAAFAFVGWREIVHERQIEELISRICLLQSLPPLKTPFDQATEMLRKGQVSEDNTQKRDHIKERLSFTVPQG